MTSLLASVTFFFFPGHSRTKSIKRGQVSGSGICFDVAMRRHLLAAWPGLAVELFKSVPYGKRALLVAKQSNVEELFSKATKGRRDEGTKGRRDEAVAMGVLFGSFGGKIDGDSWFTWWFN